VQKKVRQVDREMRIIRCVMCLSANDHFTNFHFLFLKWITRHCAVSSMSFLGNQLPGYCYLFLRNFEIKWHARTRGFNELVSMESFFSTLNKVTDNRCNRFLYFISYFNMLFAFSRLHRNLKKSGFIVIA
jgi:hypothetical protein